jgi:hypothetical protein
MLQNNYSFKEAIVWPKIQKGEVDFSLLRLLSIRLVVK